MAATRFVLGAMTGTSMDGLDMALVEIHGSGAGMRATLRGHASEPLGALEPRLRALASQEPCTAELIAGVARELGELHARAGAALCANVGVRPSLASVHGQTVLHRPPLSWQLLDPWPIARALGCPVVHDLRGADIAEGGQGAPLTPLADWVLFRDARPRAVVNLGGFANASYLPAESTALPLAEIRGGDLCPCNQLMDRAARLVLGAPFDKGGAAAMRGTCDTRAAAALAAELGGDASMPKPASRGRSLGTGDEAWHAVEALRGRMQAQDLLATLADGVGTAIGNALRNSAPFGTATVVVAGGGVRHQRVMHALARACEVPVTRSDDLGVPSHLREAICWAVLGALAQDGLPATLPAVTGRAQRTLADGRWCFPADAAPIPRQS